MRARHIARPKEEEMRTDAERQAEKEKRTAEATGLRAEFPDYDPRYHDAFILMHQQAADKKTLDRYHKARGF